MRKKSSKNIEVQAHIVERLNSLNKSLRNQENSKGEYVPVVNKSKNFINRESAVLGSKNFVSK